MAGGAPDSTATAATGAPGLPDFAPVPQAATGPKLNDSGYFVGRISGHLHWVTDRAIFKTYLDAVAAQAAAPVAAKYTGVLAAADVFTFDHAATLVESFRIDAGLLGPFGTRP
ncbi:hypothetical protein [Streptomyces sp. NPDC017435]|uniref:hypothetical protein n=1 Tax=Streptomyces sp. NPDC017435 TaxID=3364995 RepID=UPI0037BDDF8C